MFNCFHSYRTKNKLKKYERVCNDHDHCYAEMPDKGSKMLKYSYGEKSLKAPFMIYAGLECLLDKMHSYQKKSYTEKKNLKKILYGEKKLSIHLLFAHCLQIVHLVLQKTNLIVTEGKTV